LQVLLIFILTGLRTIFFRIPKRTTHGQTILFLANSFKKYQMATMMHIWMGFWGRAVDSAAWGRVGVGLRSGRFIQNLCVLLLCA